jgi:hypothetical protein
VPPHLPPQQVEVICCKVSDQSDDRRLRIRLTRSQAAPGAPLLASADDAALASVSDYGDAFAGGGAVFAATGVDFFFTAGLAAFGRATGFAGSLPQKLNRDDSGAVALTPPA